MAQKRIFTEEEVKYIIDNCGKQSAYSMAKKLECSPEAICKVALDNGLERPKSNRWTEEEVNKLKELSKNLHYEEIAKIMNKSTNSIYIKARKLGIVLIQERRKWTKEDETTLRDLWGSRSVEYIAKKLKRSVFALKLKAFRMELGPMVRSATDKLTVDDIVDLINVSRGRITTTWIKLGLKLNKKKLTKRTSYYFIEWEDLIDFLKKNQNEWDSRNLEPYMLGEEFDWLIEKRKRDRDTNPLWYRYWTTNDLRYLEHLFKVKKDDKEIADILKRTEDTIKYMRRKLGYKSSIYWTE